MDRWNAVHEIPIFDKEFKINLQITPSECFELITTDKEIQQTISTENNNILLIEKKLIRICPTTTNNKIIKCVMNTNLISKTNTYENSEGRILQCPCYSSDCHTIIKFEENNEIEIKDSYNGIIEVSNNKKYMINQQSAEIESFTIKGDDIIVSFTNNSISTFKMKIETNKTMMLIGNDETIRFKQLTNEKQRIIESIKSEINKETRPNFQRNSVSKCIGAKMHKKANNP